MKISQSLIKDMLEHECPYFIKQKYIDMKQGEQSLAMLKGNYFEHHLLGRTRDGNVPEFEQRSTKNSNKDYRPQAQVDLDETIIPWARRIMTDVGFDIDNGESQFTVETETMIGHIDLRTKDVLNPERKCIVDVKYTETELDDRWRGWGMFMDEPSANWGEKLQAIHYVTVHGLQFNEWLPFYFAIFSSKGWARIIKVEITQPVIDRHIERVLDTSKQLHAYSLQGYPVKSTFAKCTQCPMYELCDKKIQIPEIEIYLSE